nr:MAG TPA: Putative ATP dependent Clp protease [Caudoviricetes sp.]DAX71027.1 MAG TPA: Putative ATP dependent Clp protease [Caudoviricetes sp.]
MPAQSRPQPRQQGQNPLGVTENKFWNFIPGTDTKPPELLLYGPISSQKSWWQDTVTPAQFNQELAALGAVDEIIVRINSGGGDVFAANAIYTRLRDMDAKVTVKIDGWAASAATIIAMAGDIIKIARNGVFMVHDPAMTVYDTYRAEDFEKMAQELRVIKQSIMNTYAMKTGKKPEDIADIMTAETWWTGDDAVKNGFCDELMFEEAQTVIENANKVVVNSVPMDLTGFHTLPEKLLNGPHNPGGLQNKNKQKGGTQMEPKDTIKTVSDLEAAYPDLVSQIRNSATENERSRIKAIMDSAPKGFEKIVEDAMFTNPVDAGQAALNIIKAQKQAGNQYRAGAAEDAQASGIDDVQPGGTQTGGGDDGKSVFDRAIDEVL